MVNIPLGLINSIQTQNCILFVGAGIGTHLIAQDGSRAPSGKELCQQLCEKYSIDYQPTYRLAQIAEWVELKRGRKELEAFISSKLVSLTPDETARWITSVRWKSIYTTNYDSCIERAYQLCSNPLQNPVSFSITSDIRYYQPIIDVPIFHIHGHFHSGKSPNIIVTSRDYAMFRKTRKMLFEKLKYDMLTACFLYIGYSNSDINWELLLEETTEDFYPSSLPQSFRIDPNVDEIDATVLQSKNIETIRCSFSDFVSQIAPVLDSVSTSESVVKAFKKNVPPDLMPAFESTPVPVTRLLSSWDYVNQASFNEPPNFLNFLKGDQPNWSLISKGLFFERDIQDEIFETALDFATTSKLSPRVSILLGSAGYGCSTLLKALAIKIINEEAGSVFILRTGAIINEGDIEFACTLFSNVFFIIDNAADFASPLDRSIHLLKESKKRAFFLLADRLNEWHQVGNRPRGQEFLLEPLSDLEINRLLDLLDKHHALNKLEPLPRDLQFSIVKERHQKELLVVLRESTENNNFDAIIESEYRGIGNEFSRIAYLYVCCFYQYGALVRDTMLSEILDVDLREFYKKIADSTEGVILFECIDPIRGDYAARARHHKIAAVVWERCTDAGIKEQIVQNSLDKLNLNFGTDAHAFDLFVRSDRTVDAIRTLEGRIAFFEHACRMDPKSPYVRQHYARMLSRSNHHQLALMQIDNAIDNDPNVRVLYHTRGKILSELALTTASLDIGRKYLLQAETAYNKGIAISSRDDYGYESLASLYFGWSKKVVETDPSEATDYLAKAEEVISLGLRTVHNRESLWLLSSKIQLHFGHTPKSISLLENSLRERSGSIITRYVLARAYRSNKKPHDALKTLEPVVKSSADEFRVLIEYALALIDTGETYRKAVSILQLGTLYGLSDPRFVSVYGGALYMDGAFDDADEVFANSIKHSFPVDELYQVHFEPFDPQDFTKPFALKGEVVSLKPGFSLIKPDGYPQILCHASKYKGTLMRKGLRVNFEVCFCAKGPVALYPIPEVN